MSTGLQTFTNVHHGQERTYQSTVKIFPARGFPKPSHPADAGVLSRLEGMPGYRKEAVQDARLALIGAGGLGSWIGMGIVRSGLCKELTIIDPQTYELNNASRQLLYPADIGEFKAFALARNLLPHAVRPTRMTAIAQPFEQVLSSHYPLAVDLALFGVDNDRCRLEAARWARMRRIPAVFTALSLDGTRTESFFQGAGPEDACLHCCCPDLDPDLAMPCAFASTTSCFLASAFSLFFCERALMGWDEKTTPFNWRVADLQGLSPERTGQVRRRSSCPTCSLLQ